MDSSPFLVSDTLTQFLLFRSCLVMTRPLTSMRRTNAGRVRGALCIFRVVHFYNGRGTAEQWIKEGKYAL